MTGLRAQPLPNPILETRPKHKLCANFVIGRCENPDCEKSHDVVFIDGAWHTPESKSGRQPINSLSKEPRQKRLGDGHFDNDGAGHLSKDGPRHDNDHGDIRNIRILPSTDEASCVIICQRQPYMPAKKLSTVNEMADCQFRQLRHDNLNGVMAATYHAMQQMQKIDDTQLHHNYQVSQETPCGFKYSLFRKVLFEEMMFNEHKGLMMRLSFECPRHLEGRQIHASGLLEDGMLTALVCMNEEKGEIGTIFAEVHLRESTDSRTRTGKNERAAVQLSFADRTDINAVRRATYYMRGLLKGSFALVEYPRILLAGFVMHLERLQELADDPRIAFENLISSPDGPSDNLNSPPSYASAENFEYNLNSLRSERAVQAKRILKLRPTKHDATALEIFQMTEDIRLNTTLDDGQAVALYESLNRQLAFTQGPPGTGKSYLGVSLAQVILDSQPLKAPKPILVVCMTNHALDSFLDDLVKKGFKDMVRLGAGSKEKWTGEYLMTNQARKMKHTQIENRRKAEAHHQAESLAQAGAGWAGAFNKTFQLGWYAIRDHLKKHHRQKYDLFSRLEKISLGGTDIRRAKGIAGFGYQFWLNGGDINNMTSLMNVVDSLLDDGIQQEIPPEAAARFRERLLVSIKNNVVEASTSTIWSLSVDARQRLANDWAKEIDPRTTCDAMAEMHRRQQSAMVSKAKVYTDINARCLAQQQIIGLTTSGVARHLDLLKRLDFQVAIIEEAGEVMEAHSLVTLGLQSLAHYISIGDPQQLRPQLNELSLSMINELGKRYRLDESLFERFMFPPTGTAGKTQVAISRLNTQRRMHPDIADISRATLYPFLIDHESTGLHPPVPGMADRIFWLDHRRPEDIPDPRSPMSKSHSNKYEVEMTAGLVKYLMEVGGYKIGDIAIVTPYNGQLAAIAKKLQTSVTVWLDPKDREKLVDEGLLAEDMLVADGKVCLDLKSMLRVVTIDNFQGEEARVIIFSAVRNNTFGSLGFLTTENRVNVACSRARDGFYVLGNTNLMAKCEIWSKIINVFKGKGKIGPAFKALCSRHPEQTVLIKEPCHFGRIPECSHPCKGLLPCGHPCTEKCHDPALHDRIPCAKPCPRILSCGHPCQKRCNVPCGSCEHELAAITLSCSHEFTPICGSTALKPTCKEVTGVKKFPCSHIKEFLCSTEVAEMRCELPCERILLCGHKCTAVCGDCEAQGGKHSSCKEPCGKLHECGHKCKAPCGHRGACPKCEESCKKSCQHGRCGYSCNKVCDPCVKPCDWYCEHQGECHNSCSLPCDRIPCSERCTKVLPCGLHICPGLCGETCMRSCEECAFGGGYNEQPQISLPCGHILNVHTLDKEFNMRAYYRYGNSGKIVAVNIKDRPSETGLRCPICTEPVHGVRRYAIVDKIMALPHTLETMYAKLGRKLDMFEHQVSLKEKELDMTFNISCKTISTDTGPTTNPRDTDLVLSRSKFLKETQQDILRMRDEVAVPFEKTIFNLRKLFENPGRIPIVALPFKLRYESLWYRGRLIAFDESLRMIGHLQTMDQSIQHIPVLMEGLRMRAMEHTLTCIEKLKALILESESMSLKRLEVEFRLLQFAIFLVAKDLDQTPNLDIKATIARTAHLCKAFPDTAGKFLPCLHQLTNVYLRLAKSVPGRIKDWNCPPLKILWQCWGKYNPGHLQYCQYGHPFSRQSFPYCPECGRELKVVDKNAKPHASAYASVRATQAKRDIRVRLPSAWSTAPPPTATASAKTSSTMAPSATALAGPSATSEATKNS